jgi:adenylate kinase
VRVLCTGISGTDRLQLLRDVVARARENGVEVGLYDVRETMFELAKDVGDPVDEETILDMFPRALVLLRAAALENILSRIEAEKPKHWIINTHAVFRWKNSLISGFDPHYLGRLDPHLFVTVTTGVQTTYGRLKGFARWNGLSQEDVLTWREEEQFFTEEMARIHRKPQVLLPRRMGVEAASRLMLEPRWKKAYLSYPMQHVAPGQERGLAEFKRRLEEVSLVFDPADVNDFASEDATTASDGGNQLATLRDDEATPKRDRLQQHIADQIVVRDYKLVQQSDLVVVYYDAPVPSPGVISEMKYALENGKQVYGVWLPKNEPSVFFTRYCSIWFRTEDALFDHLRKHKAAVAPAPPRPKRILAEREAERIARTLAPRTSKS